MLIIRSLAYQIVFYLIMAAILIVTLPFFFFLPHRAAIAVVKFWTGASMWALGVVAGTKIEVRGLEKLPKGGALIAPKHQSAFETMALFPLLSDPTFVMKRQLMLIPLFGWYTWKAGMIPVDRAGGSKALRKLAADSKAAAAAGRQVILFPEGTRRPAGAPPDYKFGIIHLYRELKVPVVPIALNAGLYWPRRSFLRYPGTIIIEVLDPIQPGLDSKTFLSTLIARIEPATDHLMAEAAASTNPPPIPAEAQTRISALAVAGTA
ncbi:lysophospholipid acyltransferase family protein [Kaistia dalseonensis]|uniref:1-acyl-sn-glycerol-3-phosphate acyltransferase n=1 Tax=Kaistia dalseonensis TaxID=410840 RepID=A0ABU0H6T3_9HYPH|nr:lysophospholipid acyltransferase family protein [Kaistia dalseonensis]MCX5494591.1 lysophospholipid acyltransferase family protein [Kaistia dalseonensis]MDQ0437171.1 1-acyl-sn-glycerol-3-phosphate acyltransferase [Kaistia dalseonensis]